MVRSTQQRLIYLRRPWATGPCHPCHYLLPSHNLLLLPLYLQFYLLFSSKLSQLTDVVQNSAGFSLVMALLQNKCVFLMWAKWVNIWKSKLSGSVYGSHGLTAFLTLSSDEWKKQDQMKITQSCFMLTDRMQIKTPALSLNWKKTLCLFHTASCLWWCFYITALKEREK